MNEADGLAIAVANFASNGMGGYDGTMLEIAVAHYGIEDVDLLLERLMVIKHHRPPTEREPTGQ